MTLENRQSVDPIEILLVEPNPGDVRLFTESFKEATISNHVHTVSDSDSALDFLHQRGDYSEERCPDLVLIDPHSLGPSGLEVLSELGDEPPLDEIPVIVLTSSEIGEDILKSRGLDADTYIQKPVEIEEFISFIQSVEGFWLTFTRSQT